MGRPKTDNSYHIPIALFQPEFAQFQEDIVSGPMDPDLSSLAFRWLRELSEFFNNDDAREKKIHQLLSELLDGHYVSKKKIGTYETDGGLDLLDPDLMVKPLLLEVKPETTHGACDAIFELVLYDREGVKVILKDDKYKGGWRQTRLPSVLLMHNGPNIQALGAVYLSHQYVQVLSPSLSLYFNEFDIHSIQNLVRFMTALRRLFRSLCTIYKNPSEYTVDYEQIDFPYPRSYETSGSTIQFKYTKRISQIRLVFAARTADGENIIVKFGFGQYGADAHSAAAKSGLAPALLSYSNLAGGMWMVVMDVLEDGFLSCDELDNLVPPCKEAIRESVRRLHMLGFVHGDLRDTIVFVRGQQDRWDCQIIDYDWAGRKEEVKYPTGVYTSNDVWRPERYMDGQLITQEHDESTMEEFLMRRTTVKRW